MSRGERIGFGAVGCDPRREDSEVSLQALKEFGTEFGGEGYFDEEVVWAVFVVVVFTWVGDCFGEFSLGIGTFSIG